MSKSTYIMIILLVMASPLVSFANAQNAIFVCTESDGTRVYQNTGETKGCRRLQVPVDEAGKPRVVSGNNGGGRVREPLGMDVPKVASFDETRRKILQQELQKSQEKADALRIKKEKNAGGLSPLETKDLLRLESDIKSLNRELSGEK
jgi:hypothetical protein